MVQPSHRLVIARSSPDLAARFSSANTVRVNGRPFTFLKFRSMRVDAEG